MTTGQFMGRELIDAAVRYFVSSDFRSRFRDAVLREQMAQMPLLALSAPRTLRVVVAKPRRFTR